MAKINKKEIEYKILELKDDYVRFQNDMEKMESVKGEVSPMEKQLANIEEELKALKKMLLNM